jgi:hypothetical protein
VKRLVAIGATLAALVGARAARAACTDAGPCGAAQYCALPDGGAVTDGGPGKCAPEPCEVKSDCPGAGICDTSVEPHRCVGCRDTADCLAPLVCDLATHFCVVPPGYDAGTDAGADAAIDGGDGGGASDAAADAAIPPRGDAGDAGDAEPPAIDAGPPDFGALRGGACDCDLATRDADAAAAGAASIAIALLWIARRRSKSLR